MAKEKRSAADLDAELAALEAELAALEAKPKKAKKPEAPAPAAAEPSAAPAAPAQAAEPEAPREKKSRFAMPKLGKNKAEAPRAAPAPPPSALAPSAEPTPPPSALAPSSLPTPPAQAPAPTPSFDLSLWRQDGDAWVRIVPDTPVPVVRRVLDENGELVREEAASARDVDEARGVKAERGLGRLLRRK